MRVSLISILVMTLIVSTQVSAQGVTQVKPGDEVILISPMTDGLTYTVSTPYGHEIWKDRDLYHFSGVGELCTVLKSYGSEVLLHVPVMNNDYWFTVKEANTE